MGRLLKGLRQFLGRAPDKAEEPRDTMTAEERQKKLARLQQCKAWGEDEYDQLYSPRTHANPAGHYSDAKDSFGEAISLATELGLQEEAAALTERLDHIKAVFRSQFANVGDSRASLPRNADRNIQEPQASSDSEPVAEQAMRKNALLVIQTCQPLTDFDFGFSAQSVEWLAGYIERLRLNGTLEANRERYIDVFGSYLGEAIMATFGGSWQQDESGWHIAFDARNKAYPFAKVGKQMLNGLDDSIFGFYLAVPAIFGRRLQSP